MYRPSSFQVALLSKRRRDHKLRPGDRDGAYLFDAVVRRPVPPFDPAPFLLEALPGLGVGSAYFLHGL